jgi:DNA (cytosine-5)-methyltransferase 1
MTDITICLNSKVDGKQPSVADRIYSTDGCSVAITSGWKQNIAEPTICAMRGRNPNNPSERSNSNGNYKQRLEPNESGTSNTITSVQKDNYVVEPHYRIRKLTPRECFRLMGVDDADIDKIQLYPFGADIEYPAYSHKERLANMSEEEKRVLMRKGISNSQQYKLAGNSIVVDVLYHLFRKMFCETRPEIQQPTLF